MNQTHYFLIIPAGGSGKRMGSEAPKQYLELDGKSLLQHTLERMHRLPHFSRIVVAAAETDSLFISMLQQLPTDLRTRLVVAPGGAERMHSVRNALLALQDEARADDWVLVHDAVRPCVRTSDVEKLISVLQDEPAGGLLAVPARDTIKTADATGYVTGTLERSILWQAVTPQMFRYGVLTRALDLAVQTGGQMTDEAAAVEQLGLPVKLVAGRSDNIKITWPEDLLLAAALLTGQAKEH